MSFISGKNRTAIPASEKGVANGVATLDSGGDVPATQLGNVSAGVFTKSYTSPEQTITAAGALTLAHGLGAMPSLIQPRLICKVAEGGYSVGDELLINFTQHINTSTNYIYGVSIVPDASNLNIRYDNNGRIMFTVNKTTGAAFGITNANWKLVVRAWA